ncbi:hypothetical protein CANMA_004384 [Candida margitis]|uniref:uncharacterized protein n=1 Tax=Candida margitis TaxID=1775924 RepID=UPI002226195B|nr:uncharacterized protein CANMA_004384 [Candida margitis]KAI5957873.1 hypothetical protein CANMA_004384 [Candida margitis]
MPSTKNSQSLEAIKEIIESYMRTQYRPYSTNDILLNLRNQVPKQKLGAGLAALVEENKLIVKVVGKTSYYCYKELVSESNSSETALLESVTQMEKELTDVEVEIKDLTTAKQLQYSASDSSKIALWGTIGTALAGPVSGAVVDRKGYTLSSLIGAFLIMLGYAGMKFQFDRQHNQIQLSCFWLFSIGLGSTFINSACLKCCAVSFPSIRGVATSLPLALYGLSALFYSVIASVFYAGRTSEFLGFVGTSIAVIYAVCFPSVYIADKEHKLRNASTFRNHSSVEDPEKNFNTDSKTGLFKSYKFWILFAILGSLASLGQMYIYSVGYIVKSLVGYVATGQNLENITTIDEIDLLIQQQQQLQVGLISIANCIGRILSGILEYDSNSKNSGSMDKDGDLVRTSLGCILGKKCYSDVLGVTAGIGCIAIILVLIFNISDMVFKRRPRTLSLSDIRNNKLYIEKPS